MKVKILLIGVVVLLALTAAYAADVTGKWVAETQGRNGPTQTTFNLKAEGANLTGTVTLPGMMGGQPTDVAITEGKIDGNNISFVVVRKVGPEGQQFEMKTTYKGAVSGDEIKFTVERQMPAGMGGGRGGGPQEIVAKRAK